MEFILILGACVGFMSAKGFSLTGVITSIIGILTVPIIPLAYCGIIAVIFMYFTHSVKIVISSIKLQVSALPCL